MRLPFVTQMGLFVPIAVLLVACGRSKPPDSARTQAASTISAPVITDEGNAPKTALLRLKLKTQTSKTVTHMTYQVEGQDTRGKLRNVVEESSTLRPDGRALLTTKRGDYAILRDDLKLGEKIRKRLAGKTTSALCDSRGNKEPIGDNDSPEFSLNFPTQPIHAGSKWKGYLLRNGTKEPVTYTVDQIIRYHGHTVVVFSEDGKDARTWFDTDVGDSILTIAHSRAKTKDGRTILTTVEAFNSTQ